MTILSPSHYTLMIKHQIDVWALSVFLDWLIGSGFLWTTRLCSSHGYIWRHQQQPYIWTAVTAVTAAMVTKEKKEGDDTCCSEDMQAVCLISSRWSGGCAMTNTGLTNALWRQGRCCYCMLKKLAEQRALTESRTFLFAIVVFSTM